MILLQAKTIRHHGFTLVEFMLGIAILGVLVSIAIPAYQDYRERVRVGQAVTDITEIAFKLSAYHRDAGSYPATLAAIGAGGKLDPWGRPYEYLDLTQKGSKGKARKDKNLVPLNSDFDVYSKGRDGKSVPPISPQVSQDDVLRANDGHFVNLASKY